MGAVYEVIHLETERRRALKVMLPHVLQSEELRERFQLEAKVAAHIESEFIVDVFDAGFDADTQMPFLVMELLRGEELGKRLKRLGRLAAGRGGDVPPPDRARARQDAPGATSSTATSSPRTSSSPSARTARRASRCSTSASPRSSPRAPRAGATQSLGTPLYMAPEQFNPRSRLTPAADLYALGMVAYTLLVGGAYWAEEARGGNIFALATRGDRTGPREPASDRAAARGVMLPPSFDAWFARATAADPVHRFPTATEMIAALAQAFGLALPGRTTLTSLAGAESAPVRLSAPPQVAPISGPAPAATAPPAAHITGPATALTGPVAAGRGKGIAVAAALALAALAGAGVYLGTRGSGASAAAVAASVGPSPEKAAPAPVASAASPPSAAAVPSVVRSAAAADVPAASASAAKAGARAEPAAAPAARAPASPPAAKKKYSRD